MGQKSIRTGKLSLALETDVWFCHKNRLSGMMGMDALLDGLRRTYEVGIRSRVKIKTTLARFSCEGGQRNGVVYGVEVVFFLVVKIDTRISIIVHRWK